MIGMTEHYRLYYNSQVKYIYIALFTIQIVSNCFTVSIKTT